MRGGGEEVVLSVFRILSDIPQSRVQHFLAGYLSTVVEMVWLVFSPEISHTVDLGQGDFHLCRDVSHFSTSPGPYPVSAAVCPSLRPGPIRKSRGHLAEPALWEFSGSACPATVWCHQQPSLPPH